MRRSSPLSEPYGIRVPKACLPCAKVKARCETEAGGEACKRYVTGVFFLLELWVSH